MTKATAHGSFELSSWDEAPYEETDQGTKLTKAEVSQKFTGDLIGQGTAHWLMFYRSDGTAHFVGLHRIEGTLGDRQGTFVLETSGDFDGTSATWEAIVIAGSGTKDLAGLTGHGEFGAPKGPKATFELDYELE
jgi:hypothetical protein